MSHTPGPWTTVQPATPDNYYWHVGVGEDQFGEIATVWTVYDSHEANARLIAAAPDLLEALKEAWMCLAYMVEDGKGCDDAAHREMSINLAYAAIAKAEGAP